MRQLRREQSGAGEVAKLEPIDRTGWSAEKETNDAANNAENGLACV